MVVRCVEVEFSEQLRDTLRLVPLDEILKRLGNSGLFGLLAADFEGAVEQVGVAMAGRLQVSVNTFKTQLQAAFAKTATHRQTDLLKLLLSLSRT